MDLPFQKKKNQDAAKHKNGERKSRTKVRESDGYTSTPAVILAPRLMFIGAVVVLCVFGLIMIYSASSIESYASADFGNDSTYFFKKQLMWLAIGGVCCVAAAVIPHRVWSHPIVAWGLWAVTLVLLIMVVAGLGVKSLGAERSLSFGGMSIQPAEFAKISVMLLIASLLERYGKGELDPTFGVIQMIVVVIVTALLIYKQPDLGTAIILAVGLISVLVLFGMPIKYIAFFVVILGLYVVFSCITQPYHWQRIMTLFNPWEDMQGSAYQTTQGFMAFGSGGIFGTGLGLSRQKYLYLPYAYNDFIFAVVGEELGLVGATFLVLVFLLLIFAGLRICRTAPDIFGCMVAGGFTCMIGFQAYVNMACVVGVFPVTGKALPFISYGGSSLLATMIMAGLILGVSKDSRLDVQSEARRDNLMVVDGGRSANRQQQRQQGGTSPAGLGGIIAGIGGVAGGIAERVSNGSRLQSASRARTQRARGARNSNTLNSQNRRGSGNSNRYQGSRRNSDSQGVSGSRSYSDTSRSSRRKNDLDVELIDIAPRSGRPKRGRGETTGTRSRSGNSFSATNGRGHGSSRQSTGTRRTTPGGASPKGRVSYGDAAKRTRNNRRR